MFGALRIRSAAARPSLTPIRAATVTQRLASSNTRATTYWSWYSTAAAEQSQPAPTEPAKTTSAAEESKPAAAKPSSDPSSNSTPASKAKTYAASKARSKPKPAAPNPKAASPVPDKKLPPHPYAAAAAPPPPKIATADDTEHASPLYAPVQISHASAHEASQRAIPSMDLASSYYGCSVRAVTPEQYQVLIKPLAIPDIEVKPDGVIYLPEIKYRRRLNEAFGPMAWGLIPRGDPIVGESIVTREYSLFVEGRFAAQAQGENNYFGQDSLPNAVEGCKSNALMRCCKDLGIASELWDPTFISWYRKTHTQEHWVEHAVTKKKRTMWFKKGKDSLNVVYPWRLAKQ